jgi:hypothetical protein
MRVIEQEDRLAALRAAKQDTDSAILSERPPELKLTMPEPLVYQVPELWDVGLREDVRTFDQYWSYMRAYLKKEMR